MERKYIAFISYRHLPLDMAIAKKLHKRIERFAVPKEYQKNGEKRLGLVFRDQDELPISSNLGKDIQQALDRSEFLIVICTPKTSESAWVMREISYFLEHHAADHVLAVLADGTPEAAFPALLTEVRSTDGDLINRIEPLAANIVADSDHKRNKLFQVESLRILAALIGCPFDALYRRELRYRRRRAATAAGVTAAVAASFIVMLLNRNAKIRSQLEQTLISESRTLAALSEQAYREGDYSSAIDHALKALPGRDGERPYVAEAEYALSRELGLYSQGVLSYQSSFGQETIITVLSLSEDGSRLVTADGIGTIRIWDTAAGTLTQEIQGDLVVGLAFLDRYNAVLVQRVAGITLYDTESGGLIWQRNDIDLFGLAGVSEDRTTAIVVSYEEEEQAAGEEIFLMDLSDGSDRRCAVLPADTFRYCWAAALSEDGMFAAVLLQNSGEETAVLYLIDTATGEVQEIETGLPYSAGATDYKLQFSDTGYLVLACDSHLGESFVCTYSGKKNWMQSYRIPIETEKVTLETGGGATSFAQIDILDTADGKIVLGSKHALYMIRLEDGEILWQRTLPGFLLSCRVYSNACMGLVLDNGTVSFCSDDGYLTYSMGIFSFDSGFSLSKALISGESYPESSMILVPENYQSRASLVRFIDNPSMFKVGAFASASRISLIPSCSGKQILAIGYSPGQPREAVLLDTEEGSTGDSFLLPENGSWDDPGKLELTEDGILISPDCLFDVRKQTFVAFPGTYGEMTSSSCSDGHLFGACISTGKEQAVRLFLDGAETGAASLQGEGWRILTVGGSGTVLKNENGTLAFCSRNGQLRELGAMSGTVCALADGMPLLAACEEGNLILYDLEKGTRIDAGSLPPATCKLQFAYNDSLLLSFSETGTLCVFRTSDGKQLHDSQHGAEGILFRKSGVRYASAKAENENRLLVLYDDAVNGMQYCIVIDMDVWGCAGVYDNVSAYVPGRDSVLVCQMMNGVYLSPFRSCAEIIDLARQINGQSGE